MTAVVYATKRDVRELGGIPRGLLGNEGRIVASSLASTDTIELNEHGFETDDALTLRASDGGTLSAPLVAGVTYYAISTGDSTFKLAAAQGGPPINLTTDGDSMIVSAPLPVDRLLEYYSRWVEPFLPAHIVPLTAPYPIVVVGIVAQLTGKALLNLDGKSSDVVNAAELAAKAQLERWAAGVPLRDLAATTSANLSIAGSASCPERSDRLQ